MQETSYKVLEMLKEQKGESEVSQRLGKAASSSFSQGWDRDESMLLSKCRNALMTTTGGCQRM